MGDSGLMRIDSDWWLASYRIHCETFSSLSISILFRPYLRSFVLALAHVGKRTHFPDVTTGHLPA